MRRAAVFALSMVSAAAQFVTPVPAVMPAWLTPYPGVSPQTRQAGKGVESIYLVPATAHDVLAHFRSLFASAGVQFEPSPAGHGFLIRAAAPECDLAIDISRWEPNTQVKINCSPRLASTQQILDEHAAARSALARNDPMKTFDNPVYPVPKPTLSPLSWPTWLVRVDGARLPVERFSGQLRSSFLSAPAREDIQYFYANLLALHGYRVTQGTSAVPEKFGSWVQGNISPDPELGRKISVWVKIKPAGQNFTVELSLQ